MTVSTKRTVAAPSVVSQRLEILSVDLLLDDIMAQLGRGTVRLETDEQRGRFREWQRRIIEQVLFDMRWAVFKGAERGIDQVIELAMDPEYYKTRAERRRQDRDRRRIDDARQRAESEKYRQEVLEQRRKAEEQTRELIQAGKLVPIPSHRWKLRELDGGKADPPPESAS